MPALFNRRLFCAAEVYETRARPLRRVARTGIWSELMLGLRCWTSLSLFNAARSKRETFI